MMEQAWDAETGGLHSDDGKAFPPPTPGKEEGSRWPADGPFWRCGRSSWKKGS